MNYTENQHLPQWEESDRILRTDFNSAMASIENGINTALNNAAQANTAANTKPYVTGSYTGAGEELAKTVRLGFRPSFVIISGAAYCRGVGDADPVLYTVLTGGNAASNAITFTDTGFTAQKPTGYPSLNDSGRKYDYIAFK